MEMPSQTQAREQQPQLEQQFPLDDLIQRYRRAGGETDYQRIFDSLRPELRPDLTYL